MNVIHSKYRSLSKKQCHNKKHNLGERLKIATEQTNKMNKVYKQMKNKPTCIKMWKIIYEFL